MARKQTFQAIVDQLGYPTLMTFEVCTIPIQFPNVKTLLSFLPMKMDDSDCEAMWKLLKHWGSEKVTVKDSLDQEVSFPTDVVVCQITRERDHKRANEETSTNTSENKQRKVE